MQLDWGSLRRMEPVSRHFGFDRGNPVDRYYIENFLSANAHRIRGRALEIGDDTYTRRFGGDKITRADTFHAYAGELPSTFVGDLSNAPTIPSNIFDCAIITQTLQMIPDPLAALRTLHRILKPGGVLLATVPAITTVSAEDDEWSRTWFWSFTPAAVERMAAEVFTAENSEVGIAGNLLAATCILQGVAVEDISPTELDPFDPAYPVIITLLSEKS